jgi:flagellar biosynthesis protein FlhB
VAEEQDPAQKTEEPSQRRLEEARRKGQVASSREVNHAMILGAGALLVGLLAPALAGQVATALRPLIERPHSFALTPGDLDRLLAALLGELGLALLLAAGLLFGTALASGLIQNGPILSPAPLAPKLERISPLAGARRLLSLRSLVEFGKGIAKMILVAAAGVALLWPARSTIVEAAGLEIGAVLAVLHDLALRLLAGVAILVGLIALLDGFYQRFEHRKQLRMSRRELRDEFKQTEGDPFLKARLKGQRMERARRRMMAAVPDATVVITNPTHYAVALRYQRVQMAAPQLVAKGVDSVAQRIRELAREHHVPVIENPPLARALHGGVELGAEIPQVHYQAVAEVIGHVMRLKPTAAR